ncbi:MAG: FkbM family methyltransferase [Rhodospirillales bacterium]|nr:FkbM family methyltransferase [Rhodospirillales bacterium]
MSRTAARLVAGFLDAVNTVQPRRQRGKTVANLLAALERRGTVEVATTHGGLRFLGHRGRHVAGALGDFFADEPETLAWIDAMTPREVLWDIGASFGQFALYAARRGARVVAFEPKATSYALLVEHVALNDLAGQVTPLPLALADRDGLASLVLASLEPGAALNSLAGEADQFGRVATGFPQPVLTMRLDSAVASLGLPPPDHVKLDVDGAEALILRGGAATLARARSVLIEVEGEAAVRAETVLDPIFVAAGLTEDRGLRERGSQRNRLYRRIV